MLLLSAAKLIQPKSGTILCVNKDVFMSSREELCVAPYRIRFVPYDIRYEVVSAKNFVRQYPAIMCLVVVQLNPAAPFVT